MKKAVDNFTVKLQLKIQVDTCNSLRIPSSLDCKNVVSRRIIVLRTEAGWPKRSDTTAD